MYIGCSKQTLVNVGSNRECSQVRMVDAISQPGCAECGAGGLVLTDYRPYAFLRALFAVFGGQHNICHPRTLWCKFLLCNSNAEVNFLLLLERFFLHRKSHGQNMCFLPFQAGVGLNCNLTYEEEEMRGVPV